VVDNNYPITTSIKGQHVYRRIRCDQCDTTHVKITFSAKDDRTGCTIRHYQCQECRDLVSKKPHNFKVVIV